MITGKESQPACSVCDIDVCSMCARQFTFQLSEDGAAELEKEVGRLSRQAIGMLRMRIIAKAIGMTALDSFEPGCNGRILASTIREAAQEIDPTNDVIF